jgi:phosphate starvation-inducible protein PhoH
MQEKEYRKIMAKPKARRGREWTRSGLKLNKIDALTEGQANAFLSDKQLVLYGAAGTGKTFISLYMALQDVQEGIYNKVVIIRSAVPSREIGFLKGSASEKMAVYEKPYIDICNELFGRGDAYSIMCQHDIVEFMPSSFLRGTTFGEAVVIVDECQNMTGHELDTIMTRMGPDSRVMFCGDFMQSDLDNDRTAQKSGLYNFIGILKGMDEFDLIEYKVEDIVRSGLVKSYIKAKLRYNT